MAQSEKWFEEAGYIQHKFGRTFYRRMSSRPDFRKKKTPAIVLHGGPGSTHFSMLAVKGIARDRDVIFYDQVGCGLSSELKSKKLMTISTFVKELEILRRHLKIKTFHLLGHSWGAMLGIDYYRRHPSCVASIIFSSPCLSAKAWHEDAKVLIRRLPTKWQKVIHRHESRRTTNHPDYKKALDKFYAKFVYGRRFVVRRETLCSRATFGREVYATMWGPSEFCPTGSLKTFEREKYLAAIRVPVLFACGSDDEATPHTVRRQSQLVRGAEFHVFADAAHTTLSTSTAEYLSLTRGFWRKADR